MLRPDPIEKLDLLIKSSQPIITCETVEEERVRNLLRLAAYKLQLPFFEWSIVDGFTLNGRGVEGNTAEPINTVEPVDCLQFIRGFKDPAVFLINDFIPHLQAPTVIRLFREVASKLMNSMSSILLCSPQIVLPPELSHLAVPFELKLPTQVELRALFTSVLESISLKRRIRMEITPDETKALLNSLSGLTLRQARQVLTYALMAEGSLTAADIQVVLERKSAIVQNGGLLEVYSPSTSPIEVGGFKEIKAWLATAQVAFSDEARKFNLSVPKGILLVGVPGCGKSLCAKMIASAWQQPLVRMDASRLFDKFVGESERNFRKATNLAEAMAPCVFWIDELEKTFSGNKDNGGNDGGVGQRMFGAFLTWLQEKNEEVFLVATANDISGLPPELIRKGRFDEIFFVDLPSIIERAEIFAVQLKSHNLKVGDFDVRKIAAATDGFSGAEIEQLIATCLLKSLQSKTKISTELLIAETRFLVPLAKSRADEIDSLRAIGKARFRPAG